MRWLAILLLLAVPAVAQEPGDNLLPEPTMAAAQARSAQRCQQLGCDGVRTVYWWGTLDLAGCSAGEFWLEIGSGDYGAAGLTNAEIASLVPYGTLEAAGCFPPSE